MSQDDIMQVIAEMGVASDRACHRHQENRQVRCDGNPCAYHQWQGEVSGQSAH